MIPRFSLHSCQLTRLLKTNSSWRSGQPLPPDSLDSFCYLRTSLSKAPLLAFPDPNKKFFVFTDAALGSEKSPGGLGAVLCQEDDRMGKLVPVAYASRALRDNEKSYSAFLLEMSAIVFAITHWHTYLYGRFFHVYCDHKPIEKLGTVHRRTLNRLQELMLDYNFELTYNPGVANCPADALSRNPVSALGVDVDLPSAQKEDTFCSDMIAYLEKKILPTDKSQSQYILRHAPFCKLSLNGTLMITIRRSRFLTRDVVVVPHSFQMPLVAAAHSSKFSGHLGVFKTVNRLLSNYWWPTLQNMVKRHIHECLTCQLSKTPPQFNREKLPMQPLPLLDSFNDRVHIDTIGKMKATKNPWLLVITCAFSKYVVAVPLDRRDATTQANAIFDHWISRFGCPKQIIHDGDPAYCSTLFQELCKKLGTKTTQISSYHSQSNGNVEIYNKVFQGILRSVLPNTNEPYESWLPVVSLAYNSSVNRATNSSPFFLLFGCDPRLPQFDGISASDLIDSDPVDRLKSLELARGHAREQLHIASQKNKAYYDRFTKECTFKLFERCLLHFPKSVCKTGNPRFFKPWKPVYVERILSPTTYVVQEEGRKHAKSKHTVHANRLKKFFPLSFFSPPTSAVERSQSSFHRPVNHSSQLPSFIRQPSTIPVWLHDHGSGGAPAVPVPQGSGPSSTGSASGSPGSASGSPGPADLGSSGSAPGSPGSTSGSPGPADLGPGAAAGSSGPPQGTPSRPSSPPLAVQAVHLRRRAPPQPRRPPQGRPRLRRQRALCPVRAGLVWLLETACRILLDLREEVRRYVANSIPSVWRKKITPARRQN